MSRKLAGAINTSIRAAFLIGPLLWIFSRFSRSSFSRALSQTAWWTLPVVLATGVLCIVLQGVRWWVLLRCGMPELSLRKALLVHFKSVYYSIVMPTSAAQDVLRAYFITAEVGYAASWASAWVAKIIGLVALLVLSAYGFLMIDDPALPGLGGAVLGMTAVFFCLLVISFSKSATRPLRRLFSAIFPGKFFEIIATIRDGVYNFRGHGRALAAVAAMTLVIQLLAVISAVVMVKGISGTWHIAELFAYVPLIELITIALPLTPNGLGIREGLSVLMLARIGLTQEQSGVYVLFVLVSVVVKLSGLLFVVFEYIDRKRGISS